MAVRRSKLLPFGGDADDQAEKQAFAARLSDLAERARTRQRMTMTEAARAMWVPVYAQLSADGDGLHGAVTARAEAQVIRLALVYALLDGAAQIDQSHLLAALAVCHYCDQTAKHVFGTSLGDRIADEIARRLESAGDARLSRDELRNAFNRHVPTERIVAALELLRSRNRVEHIETAPTGGRPAEVWRANDRAALRDKRG